MHDEMPSDMVKEAEVACVQKSKELGVAEAAKREAENLPETKDKQVQVAEALGQQLLAEGSAGSCTTTPERRTGMGERPRSG